MCVATILSHGAPATSELLSLTPSNSRRPIRAAYCGVAAAFMCNSALRYRPVSSSNRSAPCASREVGDTPICAAICSNRALRAPIHCAKPVAPPLGLTAPGLRPDSAAKFDSNPACALAFPPAAAIMLERYWALSPLAAPDAAGALDGARTGDFSPKIDGAMPDSQLPMVMP